MMLFSSLTYTETDRRLMERFVFTRRARRHLRNFISGYAPRLKGFFIRMMSRIVRWHMTFYKSYFSAFMKHGVVIRLESNSPHGLLPLHIIFVRMNTGTVKSGGIFFQQSGAPLEKDYCVSPEFESMHDRRIFNEQLKKVLASLTSKQRAAYTLRYEEELSVRESADSLSGRYSEVSFILYT